MAKFFTFIKILSLFGALSCLTACSNGVENVQNAEIIENTYTVTFFYKKARYQQNMIKGVPTKLMKAQIEPPEGKTFDFWSTKADPYAEDSVKFQDEAEFTISERWTILYANWKDAN